MKRGQAAFEFLFTYGWAFMLILLAISSLYYFGVLDFDVFVQNSCSFNQNIGDCVDFQVDLTRADDEKVRIKLANTVGQDLNIHSCEATVNDFCEDVTCTIEGNTPPTTWSAFQSVILSFGCADLNTKVVTSGFVDLNFSFAQSLGERNYFIHGSFITKTVIR